MDRWANIVSTGFCVDVRCHSKLVYERYACVSFYAYHLFINSVLKRVFYISLVMALGTGGHTFPNMTRGQGLCHAVPTLHRRGVEVRTCINIKQTTCMQRFDTSRRNILFRNLSVVPSCIDPLYTGYVKKVTVTLLGTRFANAISCFDLVPRRCTGTFLKHPV
jgi:hypothetical protein